MERFAELFGKRPDSAPGAIKPGLCRAQKAYKALGYPGREKPIVLIGGTNGKGTTAASLWQMLVLSGAKPALYTSPHLLHFRERFAIGGQEVGDEMLVQCFERLKADLGHLYEEMSFFEVATMLALRLFDEQNASHILLEVGLGGRFDATNVVEPDLSIITSVGLDHQAYLGDTVAAIAFEKAGIMRPEKVTLWAGLSGGAAEADKMIRSCAEEKKAKLRVLGEDFLVEHKEPGEPAFLQQNRALAWEAFFLLGGQSMWKQICERWNERPQTSCTRGRFQYASGGLGGRDVLVDVCHNEAGVRAFVEAFQAHYPERTGLPVYVTTSGDKDHAAIARALALVFSPIIFFPTSSPRSWRPKAQEVPPDCQWFDDLTVALATRPQDEMAVLCGSILGIGALMEAKLLKLP